MAAITNLSDIINKLTGGNNGNPRHYWFSFDNRIQSAAAPAPIAGQISSLWRFNKTNGQNGAAPTTVISPNNTTLGSLRQSDPDPSRQLWLLGMELSLSAGGVLSLYDRLLQVGGLSGTVTTAQTVGGSITRNTGGSGNEIWIEISAQIGATATTVTASYTNSLGVSGKITLPTAIGGTGLREETRIIKLPLADGDVGVQSVQSVTLAATTGTVGDIAVLIAKPITMILNAAPGGASFRDFISGVPSLPEIPSGACLAMAWLASTTSSPRGVVGLHMIEA